MSPVFVSFGCITFKCIGFSFLPRVLIVLYSCSDWKRIKIVFNVINRLKFQPPPIVVIIDPETQWKMITSCTICIHLRNWNNLQCNLVLYFKVNLKFRRNSIFWQWTNWSIPVWQKADYDQTLWAWPHQPGQMSWQVTFVPCSAPLHLKRWLLWWLPVPSWECV